MKGYPAGFILILRTTLTALFVSGLILAPGALEMRLEWAVPWSLEGGARVWGAALHAASYFVMLFLLGALWTVHMRAGWVRRENVLSGGLLLGAFGLLALSGLGLYYLGDASLGSLALAAHLLAGLGLPGLLVAHILGAKRAQAHLNRPGRRIEAE